MEIEKLIEQLQALAKKLPGARVLVTEKAYGTDRLREAISVRDGTFSTIPSSIHWENRQSRIIIDIAD